MVDILKNEDDMQAVKLSETYGHYDLAITTATFTEDTVTINCFCSGRKSKQFSLTSDEMDTLADAWAQFKHTQDVAKELKRKRIVKFVEDARKRIEEMDATAITIEQGIEDDDWIVRYSHKPKWDYPTDASELDSALTGLINRIQDRGFPLKADEVPSTLKSDAYTIAWIGSVPANTTFSNASSDEEDAF